MNSRSFFRAAITTYGTQLAVLPLSLAATAVQARLIGAGGRGQIAVLSAALAMSVLFIGLGLSGSISYHVAAGRFAWAPLRRPLLGAFAGMVAAFAGVVLLIAALGFGSRAFGPVDPVFKYTFLGVMFPLSLANGWRSAWHLGQKNFSAINRATFLAALVPLSGYWVALKLGLPAIPSTLVTLALAELVRGAVLALARPPTTQAVAQAAPLHDLLAYSLLAYLCDAVQFLTYRADVWLVEAWRGETELGHYSLAVTLAELALLAATALGTVLFPTVATQSPQEAHQTAAKVARASLGVTLAVGVVGFALAVPLLPRLFTAAFEPSVQLLGVLLIGVVPLGVAKVLGNYFAGRGRLRTNLAAALVGLVVCLTGDVLTIPRLGAVGAAASTAVAYASFCGVLLIAFAVESRHLRANAP